MKILFFGLGSIGTRHARLLKTHFKHDLYALRSNKNGKGNELGIKEIYNLKDIDKIKPDIAFITNPTNLHIHYALLCAKKGINLFIEKPLSNNNQGIQELINEIRKRHLVSYTAYNLRFHPAIVWLKEYLKKNYPFHVTINASSYLPDWRKNVKHLEHYSAFKSKGGGVILELSHEIDYLYYLFGGFKKIKINSKRLSDVTVDAEDFIDLLAEFNNNIFGNIHINFFSQLLRREIILDFQETTLIADLIKHKITIIKNKREEIIDFKIEKDDIYIAQLKYFFSVYKKTKMMNNIDESVHVFKEIMKIKRMVS
jgi:predicted dehydrogenase